MAKIELQGIGIGKTSYRIFVPLTLHTRGIWVYFPMAHIFQIVPSSCALLVVAHVFLSNAVGVTKDRDKDTMRDRNRDGDRDSPKCFVRWN